MLGNPPGRRVSWELSATPGRDWSSDEGNLSRDKLLGVVNNSWRESYCGFAGQLKAEKCWKV